MKSTRNSIPLQGSKRPMAAGARLVSTADATQVIRVSIYVRRNPAGSSVDYAVESDALKPPARRRRLTDAEFDLLYGADPGDIATVGQWAKNNKLTVVESDSHTRRVLVEGSIGDVQAAFGTQLNEYDHAEIGRFRGREGVLCVPGELSAIIEGVFGLDTRPLGRTRLRHARSVPVPWTTVVRPGACHQRVADLADYWPGRFFPNQLATLYNYPPSLTGEGQSIALFAFNGGSVGDPHGGYSIGALETYFEKVLGASMPKIVDHVVHGPGNLPGPDTPQSERMGDATGEVMLDLCVLGAVAPGATITVYFTEFTSQGWTDAISAAVADARGNSVFSISYGNPEDDPNGAWTAMAIRLVNQAFEAAAAKGITICCASGDDGSRDDVAGRRAHVDFPASSPYVLGVGGTRVVASDTDPPAIASEVVWNETFTNHGAGGGGISKVFSRPAYQQGSNIPPNSDPPHAVGRGVPDVCAVGDPLTGVIVMHVDGTRLEPVGGTSASAPLWAGLVARLNEGLGNRCGFLNPLLYTKFSSGVLRDITVGNNGAYVAGPGWDACTGLGSPHGERLLHALQAP